MNVTTDFKIAMCNRLCTTKRRTHAHPHPPTRARAHTHARTNHAFNMVMILWAQKFLRFGFRDSFISDKTVTILKQNNRSIFSLVYQNTMRWIMETNSIKHRSSWKAERCSAKKKFIELYGIYLLTYSMVQNPSWEANWFAASQEIPRISRNPKVHYRTHKRPPPVSILDQPNPVQIPTSHLLEIHPNIIQPSTYLLHGAESFFRS